MDPGTSSKERPWQAPAQYPQGVSAEQEYSAELARTGYVVVSSDSAPYHPAPANPLVSIVVPFYNPGAVFEAALREIVEVMEGTGVSYELIAVSDGSTDSSVDALGSMEILNLKDVYHVKRNGKGAALRTGLRLGKGQYLGFIDADGDIDPKALSDFISVLIAFQPDIVLGSKRHPASEVVYPPLRRLYSFVYQQLIRGLFNLSVRDTQTGVKLCRREVIERALPLMVEKRFAFDLELFVVASRLGYNKFVEAPVMIRERFSSTVDMVSVARTLLDTLAIFYRERVLHFYDRMT